MLLGTIFKRVGLASILSLGFSFASADPQAEAQAKLEASLSEFNAIQQTIREEKIPLSKELNRLNSELREKRREAESAVRRKDNSSLDLIGLQQRVEQQVELIDYVANIVSDYGERFARDVSLPEAQIYGEPIDQFTAIQNEPLEESDLAKGERLLEQIFVLGTALQRFDAILGGTTFAGEAVGQGGDIMSGSYVLVGPTAFFVNSASEEGGIALNTGSIPPIFSLSPERVNSVSGVAVSDEGSLPLDITLGSAMAIAEQEDTLYEHILKGGIWIWPILFFAGLAFLTALFKVFEIYSVKMPRPGSLHEVLIALNDKDKDKALELAKKIQGPARAMIVNAVEHSDESKELIEEVMYESMLEVQPKLERMLPFIAVTAATAPLMGLLGTVTGMINTFKLITIFGTGDAKQLSSGISEALVTTEFGLIVAIPSLIIHALLNRRAQGVMATMERMAVAFVNGINRKA